MPNFATQLLITARGQIGVHEDPKTPNDGEKIRLYKSVTHSKAGTPWCADFVSWGVIHTAQQMGVKVDFHVSAGAYRLWEMNPDIRVPAGEAPEPGDIFVELHDVAKKTGHTGFVDSVIKFDGVAKTFVDVSGNSNKTGSREGKEVCQNARAIAGNSKLVGFLRPKLLEAA